MTTPAPRPHDPKWRGLVDAPAPTLTDAVPAPTATTTPRRPHLNPPLLRLLYVVHEAPFPTQEWELLMWAEHRGADTSTMAELRALPTHTYPAIRHVLSQVERNRRETQRTPIARPSKVTATVVR